MIATRRGLGILVAIAALLALLLVLDLRRAPRQAVDRRLVPGVDPDRITALRWDRSPSPAVEARRDGNHWIWSSGGATARAEPRVIREVLSALRAAHWHRRAAVGAANPLRGQLSLTIGTTARVIGIGAPLAGTEQTWLVVGDHALLVDSWVARALDPDPLALRVRQPIADASGTPTISLGDPRTVVQLAGIEQLAPHHLRVSEAVITRLRRALEALEIVRLSRAPPADTEVLSITAVPNIRLGATCVDEPALAWLASDVGDGCIQRAGYDEVKAVIALLAGPPELVLEPRPMPAQLASITLVDGAMVRLDKGLTIDDAPADPAAVAELLAVLAAPAEVVIAPPSGPRRALTLHVRGGSPVILELLGGNLVRREGEPRALRLTVGAYAILARTRAELAGRSVWTEEPTTISALTIDAITYTRGAVIGEWARSSPGPVDGARVEALVVALASPQRSPEVEASPIAHRVTLTVTGPTGAPIQHELRIGASRGGVCTGTTSKATVLLARGVCAAIDQLAR